MENIDIKKIKLVIWDLDDTFWKGTISEGDIEAVEKNNALIETLTDCGVINSICSKNDFDVAEKALKEMKLWDLFVYPSINWESKGNRIKELIDALQLRDANVLFIDDNISNIKEVRFYNPNIMTLEAQELDKLYDEVQTLPKKDPERKRLAQYKIIETKLHRREESGSNLEFLKSCHIKVTIENDCLSELERLHELLLRTNQLNYTKNRPDVDTLRSDMENTENKCGYVRVTDDYGDYGIIGFYCMTPNALKHFAFSCRCLGMGIEQYVYSKLGYPDFEVVGEVSIPLVKGVCPEWINNSETANGKTQKDAISSDIKMLLKGPCDMSQIFSFIAENDSIDCEFTYMSDSGVSVEQHNHSLCILQSLSISDERKEEIIKELPFGDAQMYHQNMFSKKYNIIFYSLLSDGGLGVYKRHTGECVAFGEYIHPLTDEAEWEGYISGTTPRSNCKFTRESLETIKNNYEYVGRLTPDEIVENVKQIFSHLDKETYLVLLLGSEKPYEKNTNKNYEDRHLFHKELNQKIKALSLTEPRIKYIEFNKYVKGQSDYFDNINHFMKPVYYNVSKEMIAYVKGLCNVKINSSSIGIYIKQIIKQNIKKLIKRK